MQAQLVHIRGNIRSRGLDFPFEFNAPHWACGFACMPGKCGLCCMTSRTRDLEPCEHYDREKKRCNVYSQRPVSCKEYPFIYGFEDGVLKVSTMLGCPATNSNLEMETGIIELTFQDDAFASFLFGTALEVCNLAQRSPLWRNADRVWNSMSETVNDYFSRKKGFPLGSELPHLMIRTVEDQVGGDHSRQKRFSSPPLGKLAAQIARCYIATRFNSYKAYSVKLRGQATPRVSMRSTNGEYFKFRLRTVDLALEAEARSILRDYVSLLLARPYRYLAALTAPRLRRSVPLSLLTHLTASLTAIEVGAMIIGCRDRLSTLDRDCMREVVSFSDAVIGSQFSPANYSVGAPAEPSHIVAK